MAPSRAQGWCHVFLQRVFCLAVLQLLATVAAGAENGTMNGANGHHELPEKGSPLYLAKFKAETTFYNDLVLFFLPASVRASIPHVVLTWMRNMVAAHVVYLVTGGLWALSIYRWSGTYFFDEKTRPSADDMWKQIVVSLKAMPFYTCLPTFSEWLVEEGYSKCYLEIQEVGLTNYVLHLVAYFFIVEFGVYWMHRGLHEIKFLYTWLHRTHHVYNKQHTLSPFAGLAFHPLDGILQASPNVMALVLVPTHFLTHLLCLFIEGIWTTNIHDCIHGNVFPIMGAGYHTIHHTSYRHNYGHITVLFDWLFGSLKTPPTKTSKPSMTNGRAVKSD